MTEEEIAAREADVLGAPPRVAPLAQAELSPEIFTLSDEINAVIGYCQPDEIVEWFRILARHPALCRLQLQTGMELLGSGALDPVDRELAILRTGWLCGAPFQWSEHVALAHDLGIDAETIERVTVGSTAPGWTAPQCALLRAVEELIADRMITDATWAELAARLDPRQLIELPALVGQYAMVAMMQNTLRLPLGDGRGGLRDR